MNSNKYSQTQNFAIFHLVSLYAQIAHISVLHIKLLPWYGCWKEYLFVTFLYDVFSHQFHLHVLIFPWRNLECRAKYEINKQNKKRKVEIDCCIELVSFVSAYMCSNFYFRKKEFNPNSWQNVTSIIKQRNTFSWQLSLKYYLSNNLK